MFPETLGKGWRGFHLGMEVYVMIVLLIGLSLAAMGGAALLLWRCTRLLAGPEQKEAKKSVGRSR